MFSSLITPVFSHSFLLCFPPQSKPRREREPGTPRRPEKSLGDRGHWAADLLSLQLPLPLGLLEICLPGGDALDRGELESPHKAVCVGKGKSPPAESTKGCETLVFRQKK